MQDSFANYMKKEVVRYIKEELNKGISIIKIREALLKGGHHRDLIEEAINALKNANFDIKRAMAEPIKSETLAQELYAEVLSSLIDYIQFQKKQGYSTKEIKNVLLRHGHSGEILDSAIKAIEEGSSSGIKIKNIKFVVCLFVFAAFILWVSASTKSDFSRVLTGFFPGIASLFVIGIMSNKLKYRQQTLLWFVPFVFAGVFFILGTSKSYAIFEGMKIFNLAVLNLAISVIFAILFLGEVREEEKPEPMTNLKEAQKKYREEREKRKEETIIERRPRIKEIRPA